MTPQDNQLLQMHMDEDRRCFAELKDMHEKLASRFERMDEKQDTCIGEVIELRTEFRTSRRSVIAIAGCVSGIASAVIASIVVAFVQ